MLPLLKYHLKYTAMALNISANIVLVFYFLC
uniref:Uncharacterized protein n=1 Tax=Anguilla anguilla TaxID=7936 RepID=A0A0E9Q9B8_ANGAN